MPAARIAHAHHGAHDAHDHHRTIMTITTVITTITTSIAITIISTIIPMLMTTSKRAAGRSRRNAGRRGGGAVSADDLAVAGVSGRGVLLFQRHRMGGGSRRYRRRRVVAGLAGRRCWRTAPDFATACFWRTPIAPLRPATMRALREIAELASAFVPSRERQLETSSQGRAFIEIARSAWNCDGLDEVFALAMGRSSIPSRSASSAPRMTSRWSRRCTRCCTR